MALTYAAMCEAIAAHLASAPSLAQVQNYKNLTEAINVTPMIQVYPESCERVSTGSGTAVRTLGSATAPPLIHETHTIHVDFYARQRAMMGKDMTALITGIDEIVALLEEASGAAACPPFGLEGVRGFQWEWRRFVTAYGDGKFVGARFVLTLQTY